MSKVYLVGSGVGDAELLTIKALRLIESCEILIYDRLVSGEILKLANKDAHRIYVGKKKGEHCKTQDQINQIIVEAAKSGKKVVRLKGGDPLIFGRGGEEALFLKENGFEFEFVAGVSAANGCGASAMIPLTHRNLVNGYRVITGHFKGSEDIEDLNWDKIADEECLLVIYMGLTNIDLIARKLMENGLSGDVSAAVIENGTLKNERKFFAKLQDLSDVVRDNKVTSPSLIYVGKTVDIFR